MRIGIITFWNTEDNYGQVLQCYALIHYLESKGHEAILYRTERRVVEKQTLMHKLYTVLSMLKDPQKLQKVFVPDIVGRQSTTMVDRGFAGFKQKHIHSTVEIYTYEDLCKSTLDVDVMICGSDQVWSIVSPLMYLQFPGKFKRLAYAASFGGYRIDNKIDKKNLAVWLKSFDLVTVREKEGRDICRNLGKEAFLVPDPTLLIDKTNYVELCKNSNGVMASPYVLLYLLGNSMDLNVEQIFRFAKTHHLEVKYVASQGREDEYEKVYPSIEEWLKLVKNANFMITNSFHGTVFALIFNIPFLTIPLSGRASRMNSRIDDLLSRYSLKNRIFYGSLNTLFSPVDFARFNHIKEIDRCAVDELLYKYLAL